MSERSDFKHTPGPWFVAYDGDPHDIRVCQQHPSRKRPHCVCCVALMGNVDRDGNWTRGTVDEWTANARLISEAPAMAEALERILNDLRTEMGALTVSANFGYAESILARVRGEEGK